MQARYLDFLYLLTSLALLAPARPACSQRRSGSERIHLSFQEKLDTRISKLDARGRTLISTVLSFAYTYELPVGIEYVDHNSVSRPLKIVLSNTSVRESLRDAVSKLPEYSISFSDGVIQLYSNHARLDRSNLLNTVIRNVDLSGSDPVMLSADLFALLHRQTRSEGAITFSAPLGQLGSQKIAIHMRNAKVYEILDKIIADLGNAIWVVRVPPERLSDLSGTLWYIYPLTPNWQHVILNDAKSLFSDTHPPPQGVSDGRVRNSRTTQGFIS
jgi:hypothetical protein